MVFVTDTVLTVRHEDLALNYHYYHRFFQRHKERTRHLIMSGPLCQRWMLNVCCSSHWWRWEKPLWTYCLTNISDFTRSFINSRHRYPTNKVTNMDKSLKFHWYFYQNYSVLLGKDFILNIQIWLPVVQKVRGIVWLTKSQLC